MMRINPDPVVLTAEDIVSDLTLHCFDYAMKDEILMMNKTEFKKLLTDIANYRAYNYEGYETSYHDGSSYHGDASEWKKTWHIMSDKLLKMFPEFGQVLSQGDE